MAPWLQYRLASATSALIVGAVIAACTGNSDKSADVGPSDSDSEAFIDSNDAFVAVADARGDEGAYASDVPPDTRREPSDADTVADADGIGTDADEGANAGDAAIDTAPPIIESECLNGVDDDGDGHVDCADGDCELVTACRLPEVWLFARIRLGTTDLDAFAAVSSRRQDRWVVLNGLDEPSTYGGVDFDSAGTMYIVDSRPSGSRILAVGPGGQTVLRAGSTAAAQTLAIAPDETRLWLGRVAGDGEPTLGHVLEVLDIDDPDAPGETIADTSGRQLGGVATRRSPPAIWAMRSVRLPDPANGDVGEFEIVRIDEQTLDIAPVPGGNLSHPMVREATGRLYGMRPGTELVYLVEGEGRWEDDPRAPNFGGVPVGEDMWADPTPASIHLYSVSTGTLGFVPLPAWAARVERLWAILAPATGSLEDYVFE